MVDANGKNVETRYDFEQEYERLVQHCEEEVESARKMRTFEEKTPKKAAPVPDPSAVATTKEDAPPSPAPVAPSVAESQERSVSDAAATDEPLSAEEIKRRILARQGKGKKPAASTKASPPPKKEKTQRVWDSAGAGGKVNKKRADELNKSKSGGTLDDAAVEKGSQRVQSYNLDQWSDDEQDELNDDGDNNNNDNNNGTSEEPAKRGFFGNLLRGLTGRTLDAADLDPVLSDLKDHLVSAFIPAWLIV